MASRPRFLSPLLLATLAIAGPAAAQSQLTDAQTRYMGAYVFEKQLGIFREYCATDPQGAAALKSGVDTFRSSNPDFAAALQARPTEPEFTAGVVNFDSQFETVATQMRTQLAQQPAAQQCTALGQQLGALRFATLLEEGRKRAEAMQAAPPPTP
jgi:hypothetical protein